MSFLNFLRRVNRGIVLAIVLVAGLTGYLIFDNIAFKAERDVIKQVLGEYTEAMQSFNLFPEEYREIGVNIPDSVVEAKRKENKELIEKFFVDTTTNYGWNLKQSVSDNIEYMLKNNQETGNKIKGYDVSLKQVKSITKYGSSLVSVEAVMTVTMTATEGVVNFEVFHGGNSYYDYSYYPTEKMVPGDGSSADLTFSTRTYEVGFTCEMTKQGGTWKFSDSGYTYTTNRW